jgi:hypothetical protein
MSAIHPVPAQRPSLAYFAFVPEGNLKGIRIVRLKARTFTKTIENALRERTVITVQGDRAGARLAVRSGSLKKGDDDA